MICVLFIGILILFFISFFLFKKNILNPSVILCSVFLISLFFSILNVKKWNIIFYLNTILIILGTILMFILGNSIIYLLPKKNKKMNRKIDIKKISLKTILVLDMIFLILLYKYFQEVYKLSLIAGNKNGYISMLYYARIAQLNFHSVSKISGYSTILVRAVSNICIFIFLYIGINKKFKIKNLYLLFPVIIQICFIILSTGRTQFIYLIIYILIIFSILYLQKYNFNIKSNLKIIFIGLISFILFLIIFNLSGYLKGSSLNMEKVLNRISIYTGSSIPAFNIYLNSLKNINISNKYFGENTLFCFYRVLQKLGFNIPNFYAPYEFIFFGGIRTNIYSAIRRYYEDFGLIGLFLITFLLGVFYGIFFHYASYKKNNFFILILYANFCFPIFEFPIEERFFMHLFPTGFISNFIIFGTIYYFLIYRNIKKEKLKL